MTSVSLAEALPIAYTSNFDDLGNPFHPYAEGPVISAFAPSDGVINLSTPPDSLTREIEVPEGLVPVYSGVQTARLGGIAAEGLLKRKNSVGVRSPITHEGTFFVERPQPLAKYDRTRSIFARPRALDRLYVRARLDYTFLEILVDPQEVLVTDQETWDEGSVAYRKNENHLSHQGLAEVVRPYARRYWEQAVLLDDYLSKPNPSFENPEVIIPFDVPVERLRVYSP